MALFKKSRCRHCSRRELGGCISDEAMLCEVINSIVSEMGRQIEEKYKDELHSEPSPEQKASFEKSLKEHIEKEKMKNPFYRLYRKGQAIIQRIKERIS